jgi:hypothetical protein
MGGRERGERTQQQRRRTPLRGGLLDRAERQGTVQGGGRLDAWLCAARGQPVGGFARGRRDQATRAQRREQHGKHQEAPGGRLPPEHPHGGLTVLDPRQNAKVRALTEPV